MIQNLFRFVIVALVISACTDLHLRRERSGKSTITKDAVGTRWIDVPVGPCTMRLLSFHSGHLRFAVESQNKPDALCDIGSSELLEIAAAPAKELIDSYSETPSSLQLEVPLASSPAMIKKWAEFLSQNSEWKNRPKQSNPWDTSEYKLIKELLLKSDVFSALSSVEKKFPIYTIPSLHIEKVNYETVSHFPFYEKELRPLGYMPQDRLPIPLMTTKTLKRTSGGTSTPPRS